jgi:flavin-dependent dehydrogenase
MFYDAAIIGAGLSGSTAARLLASWGHRVVLLHSPSRAVAGRAESIPPSCRNLFVAFGMAEPIDAAGFYRSTGNTVWWGSDEPRCEHFGNGALGYQVDRGVLDDLFRRGAVDAGSELREALIRDVRVDEAGVRVRADGLEVGARFVFDCSGRAGVVARRGWRTDLSGYPRTVALNGIWKSAAGWPSIDPTHTLVESYEDGWAWSVPLSPNLRHITAMVDPRRTNLARGHTAGEVYAAELRKARHLCAMAQQAILHDGPHGSDASVYSARTFALDPMLLVGDAASFVDPLSSYGIKKALASAWLAAVATHTALRTPSMTSVALAFHARREEAMVVSLLRQSRLQFEDAASAHAHLFWTDRAAEPDLPDTVEPDARALRDNTRVQQAFAWLKAQETLALHRGSTLRLEPHPVVRANQIVLEDRLVSSACVEGLRFVRDIDLLGVLELAPAHDEVPALFEAYNRRFPPVALPDFLGVLSVMLAFELLVPSAGALQLRTPNSQPTN